MNLVHKSILLLCGFVCGCTHSGSKDIVKIQEMPIGTTELPIRGDSDHPRFSPDGTKLIYTGKSRSLHKGSQIYEFDINLLKERRVTFSDGDAFDPNYINDDEIIYSSTTDEIKENLKLKKIASTEFPPSDIYKSDRFGGDIVRLTQTPGFDSEAQFADKALNPFVIFTSIHGNILGLKILDIQKLTTQFIAFNSEKERKSPSANKSQNKIVFLEKDKKTQDESIVLYNIKTKSIEVLKADGGHYRDVFFAPRPPERIFYSVLHKNQNNYQIEMYDLQEKCTRIVLKDIFSVISPTVSDDTIEKMAFIRMTNEKRQLGIMALPTNIVSCLDPRKISQHK